MRIMLACALGMSTGMLVEKMRAAAEAQNKEYEIWAVDTSSVAKNRGNFDVLLLGPQVSYIWEEFKEEYGDEVPVEVIKPIDYGRMNGAAVLKMAEDLHAAFTVKK
ncbi:MAG: PTS sugar transporter subunit IIB [Erysipelotrichaceae bacterium]|nr:PTS sugar transporter subunit IIB [Erysipelotrichaceae bacterium]